MQNAVAHRGNVPILKELHRIKRLSPAQHAGSGDLHIWLLGLILNL